VKLTLTRDAEEFAARTSDLFESRIECNLIATVCAGVLAGHYPQSAPLFAYGTENGETGFAALRTPPWNMLVTDQSAPIEDELVARWLEEDPGVSGALRAPPAPRVRSRRLGLGPRAGRLAS